jgi:hypothetical protein
MVTKIVESTGFTLGIVTSDKPVGKIQFSAVKKTTLPPQQPKFLLDRFDNPGLPDYFVIKDADINVTHLTTDNIPNTIGGIKGKERIRSAAPAAFPQRLFALNTLHAAFSGKFIVFFEGLDLTGGAAPQGLFGLGAFTGTAFANLFGYACEFNLKKAPLVTQIVLAKYTAGTRTVLTSFTVTATPPIKGTLALKISQKPNKTAELEARFANNSFISKFDNIPLIGSFTDPPSLHTLLAGGINATHFSDTGSTFEVEFDNFEIHRIFDPAELP